MSTDDVTSLRAELSRVTAELAGVTAELAGVTAELAGVTAERDVARSELRDQLELGADLVRRTLAERDEARAERMTASEAAASMHAEADRLASERDEERAAHELTRQALAATIDDENAKVARLAGEVRDLRGVLERLQEEAARVVAMLDDDIARRPTNMALGFAAGKLRAALATRTPESPSDALPPEVLAVLRNPDVQLSGEPAVMERIKAWLFCEACMRAEHPYIHAKGSPCPQPATTVSAIRTPEPEGPPCATCGHPRDWHAADPDTGEPPLECSPPDLSVCPCMDYAATRTPEGTAEPVDRPDFDRPQDTDGLARALLKHGKRLPADPEEPAPAAHEGRGAGWK